MNNAKPERANVRWLWEAYLREKQGRAIVETMRHTAKALLPFWGMFDATTLTVDQCRAYAAQRRAKGRADGTIHTELGHLRTVLCWGVKRRHIEHAPYIERPLKPEPRARHLTREEVDRLVAAATMPHVRLAIILLIGTGARVRAILDLKWERCDLTRRLVALKDDAAARPMKGRATVPMNDTVWSALKESRVGALSEHVIEWAGKPVASLKKGLATAARKAGIDGVSAHVLRHTAAVWMAEAGRPMDEIAQFLGHSNSNVTQRVYARYSPDYLRAAASALELTLVHSAPGGTSHFAAKSLRNLVGAAGIEPATPTMST